jgi:hypothetical protein
MRAPLVVLLGLGAAVSGCDTSDVGQPCPQLGSEATTTAGGPGSAETQEVVAYDPSFPCSDLVCIATAGRSGYCSKVCREDAGCPDGFECRVIQPLGAFAGERFCAWKTCESPADCGKKNKFCCRLIPGADPLQHKYCDFSSNGSCE